MSTFNTFGSTGKVVKGNIPVWLNVDGVRCAGGTFDPLPAVGTLVRAGTPVYLDKMGGTIKLYDGTTVTKCNGLLLNDVNITEGVTAATGAVADKGRILADRLPQSYQNNIATIQAALPNIIFEVEK